MNFKLNLMLIPFTVPRTAFNYLPSCDTIILNFPFRLAKSRLRRLLAGRPLRWVSQFSITSIPTKMLALRPLYANGEKYYAVRRNLSKNDNAICGILLYNKAISENLVV